MKIFGVNFESEKEPAKNHRSSLVPNIVLQQFAIKH
jgi:hypothetical protein